MAMRILVNKGLKVCMLEAASFPGGRIATLTDEGFSESVEAGAEFIHADLPLSIDLLKEAKIPYVAVEGDMVTIHQGEWENENTPDEKWNEFMKKLEKQDKDLTIKDFLDLHFSAPEYGELRHSIKNFAEGFDLADITKASMLSLKSEWKHFDKSQYRVSGGYCRLINSMVSHCLLPDSIIEYNCFVNKIHYKQNSVKVFTANGIEYRSSKLIITASLGMLRSGEIVFDPALSAHDTAINELGFGSVIKFLYEFKKPFWKEFHQHAAFFLSDESVPTWWTQFPAETNLLTGWLGGPLAEEYAKLPADSLHDMAIESLSRIFKLEKTVINQELYHHKIYCWSNDRFAKGGYSYNTLQSEQAKNILAEPVYDTIYFAGEAMSRGESQGTVEAALYSGKEVAEKLISQL